MHGRPFLCRDCTWLDVTALIFVSAQSAVARGDAPEINKITTSRALGWATRAPAFQMPARRSTRKRSLTSSKPLAACQTLRRKRAVKPENKAVWRKRFGGRDPNAHLGCTDVTTTWPRCFASIWNETAECVYFCVRLYVTGELESPHICSMHKTLQRGYSDIS